MAPVGGMSSWDASMDAADDEVLLMVLALLEASDVLALATSSAFTMSRLAGAGEVHGGAVRRFAAARLGSAATAAVADAATSKVHGADGRATAGALAALRALASAAPEAEALRRAARLAGLGGGGPCAADARKFLDALFRSEIVRLAFEGGMDRGIRCQGALAGADSALKVLLLAGDGGRLMMSACAQALREAEKELDQTVETRAESMLRGTYETVARLRSGVEFLRRRLRAEGGKPCTSASHAEQDLDSAAGDLDETIVGYAKEGYELACPRLDRWHCPVPSSHWWVFLGRQHAQGWAVL